MHPWIFWIILFKVAICNITFILIIYKKNIIIIIIIYKGV